MKSAKSRREFSDLESVVLITLLFFTQNSELFLVKTY